MDFLIANDKIISVKEINLTDFLLDETFVVSQKMWFGFGGIPLFKENIDSIFQQLNELKITPPDFLTNSREILRICKRMLNKNKFYRSGIIHIRLFTTFDKINMLITCLAFPEFEFPFSKHGLLVNFSETKKNSEIRLSRYRFYNTPTWIATEAQIKNSKFQSSILLNERDKVCDGLFSNIFIRKDNILFTPSADSGCYEDSLRSIVLELAEKLDLRIVESAKISKEDLLESDELFLASEEMGIQWILGIENKRFVHDYSVKIHEKINDFLKAKVI